jgi:1-acyl-sn-glycerol-3-phosphate acyltransferase
MLCETEILWLFIQKAPATGIQQRQGVALLIYNFSYFPHKCMMFWQLLPFRNGAWRYAKETGVPILPVCIQGSQQALSHKWIASPATLVLTYSEPFFVTDEFPHEASISRVSDWMTSTLKS